MHFQVYLKYILMMIFDEHAPLDKTEKETPLFLLHIYNYKLDQPGFHKKRSQTEFVLRSFIPSDLIV